MKNYFKTIDIIIRTLLISFLSLNLFSQNFEWAVQAGGSSGDSGNDITTDASGNVFINGTHFYTN
ncbi:MAG: SBBP repeat-containing protein [Bacteroidota bacterium]|nr:SBBP repeat-containing protein [Bacteroidota bacterium]